MAKNSPFLDNLDTRAQNFEPKMKNLLVETQTDERTKFNIHLCVRVVMGQIYRLNATIEKLEGFRSAEILEITRPKLKIHLQ